MSVPEICFAVLDFSFTVRGVSECLKQLAALLAPFARPCCAPVFCAAVFTRGPAGGYRLETAAVCTWGDREEVVQFCEWWLVSQALARQPGLCRLHGGAVTRGAGALLLPGDSGCGKTTLTLALVAHGFLPLADDVILLHRESFTVPPFKRCFHIDGATQTVMAGLDLVERLVPAASLPAGYCRPLVWGTAQPPRLLVWPRFKPGSSLDAERLRPAQAWMALINQLIAPAAEAHEHFAVLRTLVDTVSSYRLTYSDLDQAVPVLEQLFAGERER